MSHRKARLCYVQPVSHFQLVTKNDVYSNIDRPIYKYLITRIVDITFILRDI